MACTECRCFAAMQVVDVARFTKTAGALDFNWGANTGVCSCAGMRDKRVLSSAGSPGQVHLSGWRLQSAALGCSTNETVETINNCMIVSCQTHAVSRRGADWRADDVPVPRPGGQQVSGRGSVTWRLLHLQLSAMVVLPSMMLTTVLLASSPAAAGRTCAMCPCFPPGSTA